MRRPAVIVGAYLALAAIYTRPLLGELSSRIASDAGDPVLNAGILWWNATTLPFTAAWWNAPHYYPTPDVSAFTENLVGISVFFSPIYWVTGDPISAYNLTYFLTWPFSAFAVYLLVRLITKRDDAAFLAGLAYGFTPYRTAEIAHIQSLSSYGMPIALLGLHGYLDARRRRWLLLFGTAWLLQCLANGYFMLFGAVVIALWLVYFGSTRDNWRAAGAIAGVWWLASLPLAAIMYKYRIVHDFFGLRRSENEILAYSATPGSWLEVTGDVWFWRSFLPDGKDDLFPGLTAVLIVLVAVLAYAVKRAPAGRVPSRSRRLLRPVLGVVAALSAIVMAISFAAGQWSVTIAGLLVRVNSIDRALALLVACSGLLLLLTARTREALGRRSPLVFYATATLVIALFCCGPVLRAGGETILSPAPYRWLMALPGFDALRVPPRFWMLGVLSLSIAAGLAFASLPLARGRRRWLVFVLVAAGLLIDGWMPVMRSAAAPEQWADSEPPERLEPILELPIGPEHDFAATYRAAGHRRRVINGVSGYNPPHYIALVAGLQARDPAMLGAIASLGPFDIVVDDDPQGVWAQYAASPPGALRHEGGSVRSVFHIPKAPAEPELGAPLPIASVRAVRGDTAEAHDGRIETGWGDYPQQPDQWMLVDLGRVGDVGGVSHAIGDYFLDFPRRLAIEVSTDGSSWARVWEGSSAPAAVLASIRAPRETTMRFTFAARPARYVKLLQLETYASMWRVSEIAVHAPALP